MSLNKLSGDAFLWVLQTVCSLHRKPFAVDLASQQHAAPYTIATLSSAIDAYGFSASLRKVRPEKFHRESLPIIAWLRPVDAERTQTLLMPALILQADAAQLLLVEHGDSAPRVQALTDFAQRYQGHVTRIALKVDPAADPDSETQARQARKFGFSWFLPELLKHRKLWQEVLLASFVIQLIALATPLFTQAIIDKVVVHRTESTLIVIAAGMLLFMLFSAGLSWLRQYLVLHTGNRIDAVLGSSVFDRLFKLPPAYFQHRPTGVIAARLQGVETIREFITSAAITLILDFPFLLVFVAVMFYYSVTLTLIVLAVLFVIVAMSLAVAPVFQTRLQEQFQRGARNQAFLTEYVAGLETVKSLQLEPQLNSKYSGYLASYLQAGFATKQLANTYNTTSNLLEQLMSLLILGTGAYTVMHSKEFTIGMLVAFQMFSGRLSQPMLRLVGLWQQFQQASLSVARLGDVMNAPVEPYSVVPARDAVRKGEIRIDGIAFRYSEHLPPVYQNLSLTIQPGQSIAIMGSSGCGKSTLAKLLQGFYQPTAGRILIDGIDIRYLSANELRSHFGVVPQETTLFSGTIYDNLQMANPDATFEQITAACKMAKIHSVIEALPQGYQSEIGERGAGLSGGQKQRIAIARALLKRPNVLIFDEAVSALDGPTAEQLAHTMNALKGKATMLFITHGLPKGLHVDAIYRLGPQGAQRVALAPSSQSAATAGSLHAHARHSG
ncbi:MAG: peptidase transporter [Noviherbaspirillum sp.]|nr:peptidase transporter [Noviherbaspirillum sp.]